jgi:hypothetical protein
MRVGPTTRLLLVAINIMVSLWKGTTMQPITTTFKNPRSSAQYITCNSSKARHEVKPIGTKCTEACLAPTTG